MPLKGLSNPILALLSAVLAGQWLLHDSAIAQETLAPPDAAQASADQTTKNQIVTIDNLTWIDIRDRVAQGTTTIIIPTGGTEQNGRHMVLGKHNRIVAKTAERIAHRLGNTLVAPVLAYVPQGDPAKKTGQMKYPGTISLSPKVFEQVLEQTAQSFKEHGFKTIAFLGDSGGNQGSQQKVADRLTDRWRSLGVKVIHVSDYYAKNGGVELLLATGETNKSIGTHAGIRDTSELMAVFPQGVDLSKAKKDTDGASGDATKASKSLGEQLINGKVEAALKQLKAKMSTASTSVDKPRPAEPGLWGWLIALIFG